MTDIRPELSKKSEYWISRHRYYELKHFCLQYREWLQELRDIDGYTKGDICKPVSDVGFTSITEWAVMESEVLRSYVRTIEETAKQTDEVIGDYILIGVTTGMSYDILNARYTVPCCKDVYYKLYRKFFFLLSEKRKRNMHYNENI